MSSELLLPEPLPADPMPLFQEWFREAAARRTQPNPDAMVVATAAGNGDPSARVLLCKRVVVDPGYIVFFTNYQSRKGQELAARARAAAVFHWDALHRQVRIEGPIARSPDSESDEYFASRALESRIAAWASEQSQPLASRDALKQRVREVATRFGIGPGATSGSVPRPPHWGGNRLWAERIELWTEGANRVHDRAVWTRPLQPAGEHAFTGGPWRSTRLNP
ncbi:MAG TPA: pyridoxamine 5'-phosphate oxidase [Steroidobacteraceae bacterium]|jgi:pyridoxamine 5'-phosphate oxidase|nr:pyridoxamine 5'-phosphate oxidase [Steroidobacteraceae bacterium]